MPFPVSPEKIRWNITPEKPLLISEFGGEALLGINGENDDATNWNEDYQAKLYENNLKMFENIPNLVGISPWVLFDFRSPRRLNSDYQRGWNRKGLLSDKGLRKKSWYIMLDYYISNKSK